MTAFNESSSTSSYLTDWTIGGFSVPAGNHDDYLPHCAAAVQHVQLWQSRLQHHSADITNTAQETCVWECQDGTENKYEAAQIKVLVNESLPSQRTRHTVTLSPTLHNETSLWRADQDKCYRSLKPSSPVLTFKNLHSAHILFLWVLYISYVKQTTYLSRRTVFLGVITQRVVVISYRHFGPSSRVKNPRIKPVTPKPSQRARVETCTKRKSMSLWSGLGLNLGWWEASK